MKQISELRDTLSYFLDWNKARIACLTGNAEMEVIFDNWYNMSIELLSDGANFERSLILTERGISND